MNDFLSFFKNKINISCLLLFFILRIIFLITIGDGISVPTDYEVRYKILAENIIEGNNYGSGSDMVYPPLYPLFIALNMVLFDSHMFSTKIIQIIFDLIVCVLIYLIGFILWNRQVALIAMSLWGLYPIAMWTTNLLATESLFSLLILLFLITLINSYNKKSIKYAAMAGVFLALGMLTRPLLTYLPIVIPIIYWIKIKKLNMAVYLYLIFLIGFYVTLSPWILFNYTNSGVLKSGTVFTNGQGPGRLFFEGSDADFVFAKGDTRYIISDFKRDSLFLKYQNSGLSKSEILIRTAKEKILSSPLLYLKIISYKVWKLFTFTITGTYDFYLKLINIPFVILSLFGFVSIYHRVNDFLPLIVIILYIISVYALLISMFRYLVPIFPLFMLFSAAGIESLFTKYFHKNKILEILK
jgi:4-amino-4-deoxy-L-arabinose transferase-like glycosyltransferase